MSSEETPQKYFRWRVVVGDRPGLGRRRWPASLLGAGLTVLPRPGVRERTLSKARREEPGEETFVTRMYVVAQSVDWLRHLLDDPISLTKTRQVTIVVDRYENPARSWSGRLAHLPHLISHRVELPRFDEGRAVIQIDVRWSLPLRNVVAAALPALVPVRPLPFPASADVIAQDVPADWLGLRPNVKAVEGALPENKDIRPYDIVLTASGKPQLPPSEPADTPAADGGPAQPPRVEDFYGAALLAEPAGATSDRTDQKTVLVDVLQAVPPGRYGPFGAAVPRAELTFTGTDGRGWQIRGAEGVICGGRLDLPRISTEAKAALTEIGLVSCPSVPGRYPLAEAALLAQLTMVGVVVQAQLPAACRAHLADEVADLISGPLPDHNAEDLEWEALAIRQRRAVLRRHATAFALPKLAATAFPGITEPPSVTALLVTKRLEYVADVLTAIEAQTYPNLEVVLCLHGAELTPELRSRVDGCSRPVELLHLPAEHGFGEAIGEATARARGSLVTKFDDDDTYGPEHVWDLVLARYYSGATMVGKGAEFVYLQSLDITVRRDAGPAESFAAVVAGGTMLISRGDLEAVGGWRPVPRSIDRGLIDRVRRAGGLVYRTHPLGYVYQRRSDGHTWDPGLEYFLRGGGTQWSGLPRHAEFGTVPPDARFRPTDFRSVTA